MDLWVVVTGFIAGILIGSTGMGGGLFITPVLIFGLGVSPVTAIGSDLLFSSVTKMFGAWRHWRQKTIDFSLFKWVAVGSIPGTFTGTILLVWLRNIDAVLFQQLISQSLAIIFLVTSAVLIHQILKRNSNSRLSNQTSVAWIRITMLGFIIGILVTITSVGSGTLFMALFLFFYPNRTSGLVGTDILHGMLITGLAGIGHAILGTIDLTLTTNLLIGSIPGVLLGSWLVLRLPDRIIQIILVVVMIFSAVKLLLAF
jgi:uncharacterized protein